MLSHVWKVIVLEWPFLVFDEKGDLRSICLLPREEGWNEHRVSAHIEKHPELLDRIEEGLVLVKREYPFTGGRIDLLCVTRDELEPVMIELKNWSTGKWARYAYRELERYIRIWNATRSVSARGYLVIPVIGWFREYPAEYGFLWNVLAQLGFDPFWALEQSTKGPFRRSKAFRSVWTKGIFDDFLCQYHVRYLEAKSDLKNHRTILYAGLVDNRVTRLFVREEFERGDGRVFVEEEPNLPVIESGEKALTALENHSLEVRIAETYLYVGKKEASLAEALKSDKSVELWETTEDAMTEVRMFLSRLRALETRLCIHSESMEEA